MSLSVIIAGTRDLPIKHKKAVLQILDGIVKQEAMDIGTVISGGARGPDKWGEEWAHANGIDVNVMLADWEGKGKQAGFLRNADMADAGDVLVAMWDGHSRGTLHMLHMMKERNKLSFVIRSAFVVNKIMPLAEEPVDEPSQLWTPGQGGM